MYRRQPGIPAALVVILSVILTVGRSPAQTPPDTRRPLPLTRTPRPASRGPISGLVLQWPILSGGPGGLGQDCAQYNYVSAERHHTGLDITGTTVIAAAAGTVVVRCLPLNHPGSPNADCPANDVNPPIDNHGMQGVVILEHPLPGGMAAYTLYAHMSNIDPTPARGNAVVAGQPLGTTGGDGTSHVHFELKDRPVLHNPTYNNAPTPVTCNAQPPCYWGYTPATLPGALPGLPGHPDSHGYHDPLLNLAHQASPISQGVRVRVTPSGSGVSLRVGPDRDYRCFLRTSNPSDGCRSLLSGEEFAAINGVGVSTSGCSNGWYQVVNLNGGLFADLSRGASSIPEAWVCRGSTGQEWVTPLPVETVGLHDATTSTYFLRDTNAAGPANLTFNYGPGGASWSSVAGDWDGDGADSIGLYHSGSATFFLRNTNAPGGADITFPYGPPAGGWVPIAGDWDGNGTDTVGLYDAAAGVFYLRNANAAGPADTVFRFGPTGSGWVPLAGDWDGNGTDTVGLYDPVAGVFLLRNSNTAGPADLVFAYGPPMAGWTPIAGDWDSNGTDTAGLYSGTTAVFFLRSSNSAGPADIPAFAYGPPGAGWFPVAGAWAGTAPPLVDVAGTWAGTWSSTTLPGVGGTILANLVQAGPALGGTVTITGSPVISTGNVSGTVVGQRITLGVLSVSGVGVATFEGTASGSMASGTYSTIPPGDAGTWQISRI